MFQSRDINFDAMREEVLRNLYILIGNTVQKNKYAFKGGYILQKRVGNIRRTSDIDITILNEETFELIMSNVTPYLNNLVNQGYIWKYEIACPEVTATKNKSGGVKLYIKFDDNSKRRTLCGIDLSIHPLNKGITLELDNVPTYSNELMLADKVSALYNSERNVLRRIRDILDIYLILSVEDNSLDKQLILSKIKERGKNINQITTFELLLTNNTAKIYSELQGLFEKAEKVNTAIFLRNGISVKDIINKVLLFLSLLRKG